MTIQYSVYDSNAKYYLNTASYRDFDTKEEAQAYVDKLNKAQPKRFFIKETKLSIDQKKESYEKTRAIFKNRGF